MKDIIILGTLNCQLTFMFQANNLFKLVVAGVQLVGRAFGRALRKEFAGEMKCFTVKLYLSVPMVVCITNHTVMMKL